MGYGLLKHSSILENVDVMSQMCEWDTIIYTFMVSSDSES